MPPLQTQASEIRKTETALEYAIIKLTPPIIVQYVHVNLTVRNW